MNSEKNLLIVANPGTGKTTRLAERVVELLSNGVDSKDILCITFTVKAAQEMREKIRQKASEKGIGFERLAGLNISTFHSYALDYLQMSGNEYEVLGNNAMRFSVYKSFRANKAFNYSNDYIIGELVPKVENAIRYIKSFGVMTERLDLKRAKEELEKIYYEEEISNVSLEENLKFMDYFLDAFRGYERSKPEGFIDYNDMLIKFIERFDGKKKYRYVLVDELQDVNNLEAEIAAKSGDTLFLVGDRKQSIFGFQGGSTRNFLNFQGKGDAEIINLNTNYRSPQAILDYSTAHFLSNTKDKSYKDELDGFTAAKNTEGRVIQVSAESPENAAVKKAIEMAKAGQEVAIITRANSQLVKISSLLDSKGIEYTTTASSSTSKAAMQAIVKFLKGILYDEEHYVIDALFTPYSNVPLKKAFEISERFYKERLSVQELERIASQFYGVKNGVSKINDLEGIFERCIMPISVSIGKDYFITASSMLKNLKDFLDVVKNPTREDFFDYLSITEDSYEPIGARKGLVLTTVHKAKGLEFGNVIYVPKKQAGRFSFVDAVVYAIIKSALDLDVREDFEEEDLRVDFVAFTRTKGDLYIVTSPRDLNRYSNDKVSDVISIESEAEPEPLGGNFDEAYRLFVNKDYEATRAILDKKDPWLLNVVEGYFNSVDKLSYSLIEKSKDPYEFLKRYIFKMPLFKEETTRGLNIHKIAEMLFRNGLDEKKLNDGEKRYLANIRSIGDFISKKYKALQIDAEISISIPVKDAFGINLKRDVGFVGIIDALYRCKDGRYIIVDYKTDKTDEDASTHRKQLSVYKRLLSKSMGINNEDIIVAIAYLGLKGRINTGKLEWKLDDRQPQEKSIRAFEEDLSRFAAYINDYGAYVKDLSDCKGGESLFAMVKKELLA